MTGLVGIAASLGDIGYRYTPNDIDETHIACVSTSAAAAILP